MSDSIYDRDHDFELIYQPVNIINTVQRRHYRTEAQKPQDDLRYKHPESQMRSGK